MGNRRARSVAEIKDRRQEILEACDTLYLSRGYEDVTLKEISQMTSITRTAIYTYYKTKEEIFLDILKQEYLNWQRELEVGFSQIDNLSKEDFCRFLTDSLMNHGKLLKLLAEHYDSIENRSRSEKLGEYKRNIHPLFSTFLQGTKKNFPESTDNAAEHFRLFFFASIGSIYSITNPTEKQIAAMQSTSFYKKLSLSELFYEHTLMIARDL
jgi:AcrR family transcriptional regulator